MITAHQTDQKDKASEGSHWYLPDGTPFYDVPNKSKPGEMRPVTLRDARTVGAVPSVTTILKCAEKPGLRRYLDRMIFEATYTTPRLPDETDDQHFARCLEWADEHSRIARERGTEIHAAIEETLSSSRCPVDLYVYANAAMEAMRSAGINWSATHAERSFAHPSGFGGKVDLHGDFVIDFKTKAAWTDADVKRGLAYDEHCMQLAAYREGLKLPKSSRLINIFISTDEPGKYHVHEWSQEDAETGWQKFQLLLSYWKLANKYDPTHQTGIWPTSMIRPIQNESPAIH